MKESLARHVVIGGSRADVHRVRARPLRRGKPQDLSQRDVESDYTECEYKALTLDLIDNLVLPF